jgi:acetylglutamate kinase
VFLTDVPGVFDERHEVIPQLSRQKIAELCSSGVISEGMLPKTRACERALSGGIQAIHIVAGREPDCLLRVLLQNEPLGTEIV